MKNWKSHKKFNVTKQKRQSSHKLKLMLRIFYWCFCLFLWSILYTRDHWQIIFVMLNRFCRLRKTSHSLFLMDNIQLDGIPSKIKWKLHASFTLYFKSSYRYFFLKVLFCLVALHELLHQQISFFTTF